MIVSLLYSTISAEYRNLGGYGSNQCHEWLCYCNNSEKVAADSASDLQKAAGAKISNGGLVTLMV